MSYTSKALELIKFINIDVDSVIKSDKELPNDLVLPYQMSHIINILANIMLCLAKLADVADAQEGISEETSDPVDKADANGVEITGQADPE